MVAEMGAWFIVLATTVAKVNRKLRKYQEAGTRCVVTLFDVAN